VSSCSFCTSAATDVKDASANSKVLPQPLCIGDLQKHDKLCSKYFNKSMNHSPSKPMKHPSGWFQDVGFRMWPAVLIDLVFHASQMLPFSYSSENGFKTVGQRSRTSAHICTIAHRNLESWKCPVMIMIYHDHRTLQESICAAIYPKQFQYADWESYPDLQKCQSPTCG